MSIDLDAITLDKGKHDSPEDGACLLEVVSMFAGKRFTDAPPCVSPVLRVYGIGLNDRWDTVTRQRLKPFIPLLPGTAGDGQDEARSYLALDWLIRTYTPAWLELAGLTVEAAELRGLRRIADLAAAEAARPVVRNAHARSDAAGAAAWAPAGAAARAAASAAAGAAGGAASWAAAGAAAPAAASAAARDAARAAAWEAASAAAWEAARDALKPTVEQLQTSALDLFHRMIDPAATP